jgi:hypothetical protein
VVHQASAVILLCNVLAHVRMVSSKVEFLGLSLPGEAHWIRR